MADLKALPLDEVARFMGDSMAGSMNDQAGQAEFLRRQTQAAQDTAAATQKYTRYMFWSVVVLTLSAAGTFGIELVRLLASASR